MVCSDADCWTGAGEEDPSRVERGLVDLVKDAGLLGERALVKDENSRKGFWTAA